MRPLAGRDFSVIKDHGREYSRRYVSIGLYPDNSRRPLGNGTDRLPEALVDHTSEGFSDEERTRCISPKMAVQNEDQSA